MTQSLTKSEAGKIIHIARYELPKKGLRYLLLRQKGVEQFSWYEREENGSEKEISITAPNVEEALRLAYRNLKNVSFRMVICGFRYTLPERDEHGINALFHQMVASYSSSNGVYFDIDLGRNCMVQNASKEALDFWQKEKNYT